MKFAKYVFWPAAIYGIIITFPLYFSEVKMGLDYPPAINHAEYFYSLAGVLLVWQVLFVFIAVNPKKYRSIMIPCILEKLSLLPTFGILFPEGRFPSLWIPLIIIDLTFAVLFFTAFKKTGRTGTESGAA